MSAENEDRDDELVMLRKGLKEACRQNTELRAERDRHVRHIDRAWAMLANCYDVESREECERSTLTHDGFLPLEMAIHAIYKRDPRVSELTAELDRLKAALSQARQDFGMVACDGSLAGIAVVRVDTALAGDTK